jgi:hypothetical protein
MRRDACYIAMLALLFPKQAMAVSACTPGRKEELHLAADCAAGGSLTDVLVLLAGVAVIGALLGLCIVWAGTRR